MALALTLRFARTSRLAIVSSGTRNARAISSVASPPSARSVSATWASSASAGWQQVKRSSSRSSGIVVSSISSSVATGTSSSRVLAASVRSRRTRSTARLRAVATSQARGLAGFPSRGQRSAAIANASWVASSARSKSPRKPIRAASTRPHSSRKTCSSVVRRTGPRLSTRRPAGLRPRRPYVLRARGPRARSPRRGRPPRTRSSRRAPPSP